MQALVTTGEELLRQIREDHESSELADPRINVNFEMYGKIHSS